jgi:hypothetical protein
VRSAVMWSWRPDAPAVHRWSEHEGPDSVPCAAEARLINRGSCRCVVQRSTDPTPRNNMQKIFGNDGLLIN